MIRKSEVGRSRDEGRRKRNAKENPNYPVVKWERLKLRCIDDVENVI
jgi:hypothetical protein